MYFDDSYVQLPHVNKKGNPNMKMNCVHSFLLQPITLAFVKCDTHFSFLL